MESHISDVLSMCAKGESLETILNTVLSFCCNITNSQIGLANVCNGQVVYYPDNLELLKSVSSSTLDSTSKCSPMDMFENNIFELTFMSKTILITNDLHGTLPELHPKVETFCGIPLVHNKKNIGIIVLCNGVYDHKLDELMHVYSTIVQTFESDRQKNIFMTNIDKELRAPLINIIGLNRLLEKTNISDTQKEYLDIIQDASFSLIETVNDIIDINKLETKKRVKLNKEHITIAGLLNKSISVVQQSAEAKNIRIITKIKDDVPYGIISDRIKLDQIIVNLLSNAIKFTNTKSSNIYIRVTKCNKTKHKMNNRQCIKFAIKDSGIGIKKKYQKRLFEPFFRVDNDNDGVGLGLIIAKHLVQLLGGHIWVKSEYGRGSTFYFTIKAKEYNNMPTSILQDKKCLVIDDDRIMLGKLLKSWSMKFTLADPETLELYLKTETYDVGLFNNMSLATKTKELGYHFPIIKTPIDKATLFNKFENLFDTSTTDSDEF